MTTATIESAVLDILSDARVVECVAKTLEIERKIKAAYRAEYATVSGDVGTTVSNAAKNATRHVRFFAENDQRDIAQQMDARIRLLCEQITRAESE